MGAIIIEQLLFKKIIVDPSVFIYKITIIDSSISAYIFYNILYYILHYYFRMIIL